MWLSLKWFQNIYLTLNYKTNYFVITSYASLLLQQGKMQIEVVGHLQFLVNQRRSPQQSLQQIFQHFNALQCVY